MFIDGDARSLKPLVSLMAGHGVLTYMSGHAHSLQHITKSLSKNRTWHQFISGGGGGYLLQRSPKKKDHVRVNYARTEWGFMVLTFPRESMQVDFIDIDVAGKNVHSVTVPCNS